MAIYTCSELPRVASVLCIAGVGLFACGIASASPQSIMTDCHRQAEEKRMKGDERKEFMRTCLEAGKKAEATKRPAASSSAPVSKADKEAQFQLGVAYAKALRASMKNPASFSLTDVTRTPAGAYCYEYRATNSFNAVVPAYAVFPPGGGKPVSGDERSVAKAWNAHCAHKNGSESLRHIRAAL